MKMVELKLLLYILFMIYKLSSEHYVSPPNYCALAMTCNHSSVPLCGLDNNKHCYRKFLDECDLYEYNCDNKAEYISSDINICNQINGTNNQHLCPDNIQNIDKTTIPSTVVEIDTTTNPTSEATTVQSTTTVTHTSKLSKITTCTQGMYNFTTDKVTEKSNLSTESTKYTTINLTTEANKDIEEITTVISTAGNIDVIIANENQTTTEVLTTTETSANETNTTEEVTEKSLNSYSETTTIILNPSNTTLGNNATTVMFTTSTVTSNTINTTVTNATLPITEQTTAVDKMDTKSENCDFPSYCDRPKVWLTTSKGETRDFYKIIKDNDDRERKLAN